MLRTVDAWLYGLTWARDPAAYILTDLLGFVGTNWLLLVVFAGAAAIALWMLLRDGGGGGGWKEMDL